MIGAVLVPPLWSVLVAGATAGLIFWYFRRMGRADVPPSRRRVRRLSLITVLAVLPILVRVLSFVDPEQQPGEFIAWWSVIFVLILVIVAIALLDMMNNLRLHNEIMQGELRDAATELAEAMRKRREQQQDNENKDETTDEHR